MNWLPQNLNLWARSLTSGKTGPVRLAALTIGLVAVWGWIDPFGIRQRLDWLVVDQFYRHRTPPAVHPDLLQISIDDRTAEELGFPLPRYLYARALRQLHSLGARVVLVDVLFSDPHDEPAFPEADRQLVPRSSVAENDNLSAQFSEDHILANALLQLDKLVLAYYLPIPFRTMPGDDQLLSAMSRSLMDNPGAGAPELADRLRIDVGQAQRLLDPALQTAFNRVARDIIRDSPDVTSEAAIAQAFSDRDVPAGYANRFVQALDRARAESLLKNKGSLQSDSTKQASTALEVPDEPRLPVYELANAADWLGFADAEEDGDGTIRSLPLVKRSGDRVVFHEALAAALSHLGVAPAKCQLESAAIRCDGSDPRVPLDSRGLMAINWPMNSHRPWNVVIPQISLADLIELDRYEFDLKFARHRFREFVAILDQEAKLEGGWNKQFTSIQAAYKAGELEWAAKLEQQFDRDGIPAILEHRIVRQILEKIKLATPDQSEGEDTLKDAAVNVLNLKRQIELIESEFHSVRRELDRNVRGKLCLIGDTTTGSSDLKQTAVGSGVPGVSVIAAAVNTILSGNYATLCGYPASAILMFVAASALLWPFLRLRPLAAGACASAGTVGSIYFSFGALAFADLVLSPVTGVVGLVALYSTSATVRWLTEYRQRKLVRTIFEAQTNPTIVQRLLDAGAAGVEEVLAPKTRQVTVFFAEIADYEELVQQVAGERLPEILARTFGTMYRIIKDHHEGTLDKYQGHAMVAFFGAPVYQPDHAQRACLAALECCDTMRSMEVAWIERGLPVPRVHVGLHTGELLVGNMSLTTRVDYTVAGENLNIAYRIGELNETYNTQVMMSEATFHRCENLVEARELDLVRIKGRREPVRAYELMSAKGRLSPEKIQLRGTFITGLTAFRNRDYTNALAMFRACRETSPSDRPVTVYIERCEKELAATIPSVSESPESR